VVSRRFVKKQQMQWTLRGAHLLLQTRTKVLNDEPRRRVPALVPEIPPATRAESGLTPGLLLHSALSKIDRKRVQRNLLCVTKRKFVVTTDSAPGLKVYANVAGSMVLTGIDQLWVADITYIRLEEFVYLAVILDAYSRRVIGGHLGDGLEDSLSLGRSGWPGKCPCRLK
jgi:transposase InsO family protein